MGFVSESGKLPMDEVTEAVQTARRAVEAVAWAKEYDIVDDLEDPEALDAAEEVVAIFPARELQVYRAKGATMRAEVPIWSLTKEQLATILQTYHPDCIGYDVEVNTIGSKVVTITRAKPEAEEAEEAAAHVLEAEPEEGDGS